MRRRRPHEPVFIRLARIRPARLGSCGIDRGTGQCARVDRLRTRRRAARKAAGARSGGVIRSRVFRVRIAELLMRVPRRRILAAADQREIVCRADVAAGRGHGASAATAVRADHVIREEIEEHRRRVVDGQYDIRLGRVFDGQRLVGERSQCRVRGGERAQPEHDRKHAGEPATE